MDCREVGELLDAYALGAAEPQEAALLEEHVAECVRCWSDLTEAQRGAASIALSTALERAPGSLRQRILEEIESGAEPEPAQPSSWARKLWPAGTAVLAAGAAASLAFAMFLQTEVNGLRDDRDQLQAEVQTTGARVAEQQQAMTVLAAPDVRQVSLQPMDPASPAMAMYYWSRSVDTGALLCNKLASLNEGEFYQVWFIIGDDSHPAGTFETWNGIGQISVDLEHVPDRADAIAVSIENTADAAEPRRMYLFAQLSD